MQIQTQKIDKNNKGLIKMIPRLTSDQVHFLLSKDQEQCTPKIPIRLKLDIIQSIKYDLELSDTEECASFTPNLWNALFHYYIDQSNKLLQLEPAWYIKINQLASAAAVVTWCIPLAAYQWYEEQLDAITTCTGRFTRFFRERVASAFNLPSLPEEPTDLARWFNAIPALLIHCIVVYHYILTFLLIFTLCASISGLLFSIGFCGKFLSRAYITWIAEPISPALPDPTPPELRPLTEELVITSGILDGRHPGIKHNPKAGFTLFKEVMETHLANLNALQTMQNTELSSV